MIRNSVDRDLRRRAEQVIPGGMWGHMDAHKLPDGYPQFFSRAEGARVWDADGKDYVDLMCSWGPMILGYRHPAVEAAAERQTALGDCMNGPSGVLVELAELVTATVPHADWTLFQKNGTDATTTCVTVARAATGRRKVLVARGAYHGAAPWCTPTQAGVTPEDRANLIVFEYNDCASLEAACEQAGQDVAAILVTPIRHDLSRDIEIASPEFAACARRLCDDAGAALIIDDVRAGFRLHLGGSWEPYGIRPDLSAWSKAIANGRALSAVTGREWLRDGARSIFVTGSFWYGAASMAAAIATITTLRDEDGIAHMQAMGERLREGLAEGARHHGVAIRQTGPVQMPMVLFEDDPGFEKGNLFCAVALRHGAYFHPRHNMFLSAAHGLDDINAALEAANAGFRSVAEASRV